MHIIVFDTDDSVTTIKSFETGLVLFYISILFRLCRVYFEKYFINRGYKMVGDGTRLSKALKIIFKYV